ncbi:MAG: transcription termination factor NusA [Microbacteriaceae bacterium]|jgi:N utilization substance protein A|nr:transcription termination factor NusA [Microbacteriaceae bacterium]
MEIDLSVLRLLEHEREIPFGELARIIEQAILTAYEKHTGTVDESLHVKLDRKTGRVRVLRPRIDDEGTVVGEDEVDSSGFGRVAAMAARRVINERLHQLEDESVLGDYQNREGTIVAGEVQQGFKPRMVQIALGGGVEAVLPPEEQIPGESYPHGTRLRVYVTSVARGRRGPQITVSRTHPGLVLRLFEFEVPEIGQGLVEIPAIAREAGHRTKIAVRALKPGVNAKGACIGELGARVRAVQSELGREKIDIVDFDDRLGQFVANALSPARVTSTVVLDEGARAVRAFVPEDQLSLAIGKEGQNARLAAKLTMAKIDIQPDSQA